MGNENTNSNLDLDPNKDETARLIKDLIKRLEKLERARQFILGVNVRIEDGGIVISDGTNDRVLIGKQIGGF